MTYVTVAVIAVIAIFLIGWKLKWVFKQIITICLCIVGVLFLAWLLTGGIEIVGEFLEVHVWSWFSHLFS